MKKLRKLILSLILCTAMVMGNIPVTIVHAATPVSNAYMSGSIDNGILTVSSLGTGIDGTTVRNCLDGIDMTGVTTIDLNAVTDIPDYSFQGVTGVNFRGLNYVNNIGDRAFAESSFNISNFQYSAPSITALGAGAFEDCKTISNIYLTGVTYIHENTFKGCTSLTSAHINGVTNIGISAFDGCSGLIKVTGAESLIGIAKDAFKGCSALQQFTTTLPELVQIAENSFEGTNLTVTLTMPKLEFIGAYAFKDAGSETMSIVADSKFASVLEGAFNNATLDSFIVKNSTAGFTVDALAFKDSKMNTFDCDDSVKSIGNNAFENSTVVTVDLGSNCTSIGEATFKNASKLKTVLMDYQVEGISVNRIPDESFLNTRLENFNFDGITEVGVSAFEGSNLNAAVNTDDIVVIKDAAFKSVTGISGSDLSFASLQELGDEVFNSSAFPVNITDLSQLATCGERVFTNATNLSSVVTLGSIDTISDSMFEGCVNLKQISLANIEQIGNRAFYGCEKLESDNLNVDNVETVGDYAFYDNKALSSLTMPVATTIGESSFQNCTSLGSVTLQSVSSIGPDAFQGNTNLKSIRLNKVLPTVGLNGFALDSELNTQIYLMNGSNVLQPSDASYVGVPTAYPWGDWNRVIEWSNIMINATYTGDPVYVGTAPDINDFTVEVSDYSGTPGNYIQGDVHIADVSTLTLDASNMTENQGSSVNITYTSPSGKTAVAKNVIVLVTRDEVAVSQTLTGITITTDLRGVDEGLAINKNQFTCYGIYDTTYNSGRRDEEVKIAIPTNQWNLSDTSPTIYSYPEVTLQGIYAPTVDDIFTYDFTVTVACTHANTHEEITLEPTCENEGSYSVICDQCAGTVSTGFKPALGHDWDDGTLIDAETAGTEYDYWHYVCQNDNTHTYDTSVLVSKTLDNLQVYFRDYATPQPTYSIYVGDRLEVSDFKIVGTYVYTWLDGTITSEKENIDMEDLDFCNFPLEGKDTTEIGDSEYSFGKTQGLDTRYVDLVINVIDTPKANISANITRLDLSGLTDHKLYVDTWDTAYEIKSDGVCAVEGIEDGEHVVVVSTESGQNGSINYDDEFSYTFKAKFVTESGVVKSVSDETCTGKFTSSYMITGAKLTLTVSEYDVSRKISGYYVTNNNSMARAAIPMAGYYVILNNWDNYCVTDENGYYEFDDLGTGTYIVYGTTLKADEQQAGIGAFTPSYTNSNFAMSLKIAATGIKVQDTISFNGSDVRYVVDSNNNITIQTTEIDQSNLVTSRIVTKDSILPDGLSICVDDYGTVLTSDGVADLQNLSVGTHFIGYYGTDVSDRTGSISSNDKNLIAMLKVTVQEGGLIGSYNWLVEKVEAKSAKVSSDMRTLTVSLTIPGINTINLELVDFEGNPMAGKRVLVDSWDNFTMTDSDGKASFYNLSDGKHKLYITNLDREQIAMPADGSMIIAVDTEVKTESDGSVTYVDTVIDSYGSTGQASRDENNKRVLNVTAKQKSLAVDMSNKIYGTIKTVDSLPAEGVQVFLDTYNTFVTTDSNGYYEFLNIAPGEHNLAYFVVPKEQSDTSFSIQDVGLIGTVKVNINDAGDITKCNLNFDGFSSKKITISDNKQEAECLFTINGLQQIVTKYIDASGNPITGQVVILDSWKTYGVTDSKGECVFTNVANGTHKVWCSTLTKVMSTIPTQDNLASVETLTLSATENKTESQAYNDYTSTFQAGANKTVITVMAPSTNSESSGTVGSSTSDKVSIKLTLKDAENKTAANYYVYFDSYATHYLTDSAGTISLDVSTLGKHNIWIYNKVQSGKVGTPGGTYEKDGLVGQLSFTVEKTEVDKKNVVFFKEYSIPVSNFKYLDVIKGFNVKNQTEGGLTTYGDKIVSLNIIGSLYAEDEKVEKEKDPLEGAFRGQSLHFGMMLDETYAVGVPVYVTDYPIRVINETTGLTEAKSITKPFYTDSKGCVSIPLSVGKHTIYVGLAGSSATQSKEGNDFELGTAYKNKAYMVLTCEIGEREGIPMFVSAKVIATNGGHFETVMPPLNNDWYLTYGTYTYNKNVSDLNVIVDVADAREYILVNEPSVAIDDDSPFKPKEEVIEKDTSSITVGSDGTTSYDSSKDPQQGITGTLTQQITGVDILDENGNTITTLPQTGFDFLVNYAVVNGLVEADEESGRLSFELVDVIKHNEVEQQFDGAEFAVPYYCYNLLEFMLYFVNGIVCLLFLGMLGVTLTRRREQ